MTSGLAGKQDVEIFEAEGASLSPDPEEVLRLLKLDPASLTARECREMLEAFLPEGLALLSPRAAFGVFPSPEGGPETAAGKEEKVLYLMMTVGERLTACSRLCFEEGNYVRGLLADAVASAGLFAFEERVLKEIRRFCLERGIGIRGRWEVPEDLLEQIHRRAFEALRAGETLSLSFTSGGMFDPVKTSCQVFRISDSPRSMVLAHDCASCGKKDCPNRKESVVLMIDREWDGAASDYVCSAPAGERLLPVLEENGVAVKALCGGRGRCGKCAVQVLSGELPVTKSDRECFSEEELKRGFRLACMAKLKGNLRIRPAWEREEGLFILGSGEPNEASGNADAKGDFGIAADIGTTTIAMSLVELGSGKIRDTVTRENRQRRVGADVLTRIDAAAKVGTEILRRSIIEDLSGGIEDLLLRNGLPERKLIRMAVSGNTTMLHFLLGYPTKELGVWPFTPWSLQWEEREWGELCKLEGGEKCKSDGGGLCKLNDRELCKPKEGLCKLNEKLCKLKVLILPGISAFVGADISAGLYECGFDRREEPALFIDLGTNAEMAIGNREQLLVTSAAAGPAFEAVNIKHGIGSVDGAISSVMIGKGEDGKGFKVDIKTIHDAAPRGICGTGLIEAASELLRNGLMDETGLFREEYFEEGFPLARKDNGESIVLTQKDIRELQLAKSAIRAGIETLVRRFGASKGDIGHVLLSGGFGTFLDARKAGLIGLIPEDLVPRTRSEGNTSLKGAVRVLLDPREGRRALERIVRSARSCSLGEDPLFAELYMKFMTF